MTDIVERLREQADEWLEMCDDIHEPLTEAADTIEQLRARVVELEDLARQAGNQFAIYANLHSQKRTPEADEKAARNREWADRLFAAIRERTDGR